MTETQTLMLLISALFAGAGAVGVLLVQDILRIIQRTRASKRKLGR